MGKWLVAASHQTGRRREVRHVAPPEPIAAVSGGPVHQPSHSYSKTGFSAFPRTDQGKARTQSPTTTNYAVEFPTFGEIAGVSTSGVQWIKPRPGKTTFVIMVSPLPGKYELPAGRPTATSYALHCTHTLTFLPASPSLLGPSTQRIHVLSSKNSSVLSHATGDHIVFKRQMTDQQPLRSDIYIRHAPSVTSRGSLQPTPRPSPRLPPPTPSGPANPAEGALWGK